MAKKKGETQEDKTEREAEQARLIQDAKEESRRAKRLAVDNRLMQNSSLLIVDTLDLLTTVSVPGGGIKELREEAKAMGIPLFHWGRVPTLRLARAANFVPGEIRLFRDRAIWVAGQNAEAVIMYQRFNDYPESDLTGTQSQIQAYLLAQHIAGHQEAQIMIQAAKAYADALALIHTESKPIVSQQSLIEWYREGCAYHKVAENVDDLFEWAEQNARLRRPNGWAEFNKKSLDKQFQQKADEGTTTNEKKQLERKRDREALTTAAAHTPPKGW